MPYTHIAYGLTITSDVLLPLPRPESTPQLFEVEIREGESPVELDLPQDKGLTYQANDSELLLQIIGIARFWVKNGREIIFTRMSPKTSDKDLAVFLLGSCLSEILEQRSTNGLLAVGEPVDQRVIPSFPYLEAVDRLSVSGRA